MISASNIGILVAALFSVLFPIGLLIWWKKKTGEKLWCFVAGAICFTVFAMGLEQVLHTVCLVSDNAVSRTIQSSPVLYMLYAAFAAGIFEETGRLFGFRVLLRRHKNRECSVAYGIGHGGIEVIYILGINYVVLLLALLGVNFGDEATNAQLIATANAITLPAACVAMFERISAMMIHIGLSMLVFTAARNKKYMWLYPFAILLHAITDAPAALYQFQAIKSLFAVEAGAFAMGIICLILGKIFIRKTDNNGADSDIADESMARE